MDVFLQALMNPTEMTRLQWLMVMIMLFIAAGSLYFVWKLYRILLTARKTTYVPNIGLKRMREQADRDNPDKEREG